MSAPIADRYLDRIAFLLRQSEAASTPHEAEAYAEKAQQLISRHQIDEAVARARITAIEARTVPVQRQIVIGSTGKRGLRTYVDLFLAIARANDVKCDIAHDSTVVYAFGFAADIDACELVYTHLLVQMVKASSEHLRSGVYKAETVHVPRYRKGAVIAYTYGGPRHERILDGYETKPVSAVTARLSFQRAFAHTVGVRLREAREYAIKQAEEARRAQGTALPAALAAVRDESQSASTELVLKAKEVEIADFYRQHSQARGSWRGFRAAARSTTASGSARAGQTAGRNANLGVYREIA